MATRLLNSYAEADTFPALWDATTFGMFDPAWKDLLGRQGFESTTGIWIGPPLEKRKKRRLPGPVTTTEPSEATMLPTALDATEDSGDGIAVLEIAAQVGDEAAFVRAVGGIDWLQRPASEFARAVRLALAAGAHLLARNLAAQGARLYPDHPELQKMARILAPPRVLRTNLPPDLSARTNLEWMRAHATEYRGQWVALKNGVLLATAPTACELKKQLPTTDGLFLTRVI